MSWKEQRHMRQFAKQTALDIKASHCIRVLWARQPHYGQLWASGDNEAREKFPGVAQSWFPETLPLRYVTPRKWGSGMSRVYHVKCLSVIVHKKGHFFAYTVKKGLPGRPLRPRPSLSQHQPLITVIRSARMSETAPILDTDLQPGWTMLFWPSSRHTSLVYNASESTAGSTCDKRKHFGPFYDFCFA